MAATDGPSRDSTSQILHALAGSESVLSADVLPAASFVQVKAALDRLASRGMVKYDTLEREEAVLEPEGEMIAANGSHEARVFEALRQAVDGLSVHELEKAIGDKNVTKLGQSKAFKEKWIARTADGKFKTTVRSWLCRATPLALLLG
jgi:phenylalanyl-tRNA synthetase alpha chain